MHKRGEGDASALVPILLLLIVVFSFYALYDQLSGFNSSDLSGTLRNFTKIRVRGGGTVDGDPTPTPLPLPTPNGRVCGCSRADYTPVCASDGTTHYNKCWAECAGLTVVKQGFCADATPVPGEDATPTPNGSPTPTPSASPTPSPTPGGSPTPSPTPDANATVTPSPTPSGSPTPSPSPTVSPSPTPSPTPDASLVGYWNFESFNSTHVFDNTSNGNTGKIVSGTSADIVGGKYGNGLKTAPASKYLNVSHSPSLALSGQFTLMGWFKHATGLGDGAASTWWGGIEKKGNPAQLKLGWSGWTDAWGCAIRNDSNLYVTAEPGYSLPASAGVWYHVACVFDGTRLTLYVDGESVASKLVGPQAFATANGPLTPGVVTYANVWDGTIDDVRVYSRALSGFEVAQAAGLTQTTGYSKTPAPADSFMEFFGVNIHVSMRYPPPFVYTTEVNSYQHYDSILKPRLLELGVRHVRDGDMPPNVTHRQRMTDLGANGIKIGSTVHPVWITPETALSRFKDVGTQAMEYIEGPNEYGHNNYGPTDMTNLTAFVQTLYNLFRGDSVTSSTPVIGATCVDYSYCNTWPDLTAWADFGNVHSYPYHPGGNEFYTDLQVRGRPFLGKPLYLTEIGYHTGLNAIDNHPAVTETVQAKYLPRALFTAFNAGYKRAYLYEFLDQGTNQSDIQHHFGMIRYGGAPKPAFYALKNVVNLLKEPGASFTPSKLDYSITASESVVKHVLFQKSNGDYYLVIWSEVTSNDATYYEPARLDFTQTFSTVEVYSPVDSPTPQSTYSNVNSVALQVPDKPLVLKLVR